MLGVQTIHSRCQLTIFATQLPKLEILPKAAFPHFAQGVYLTSNIGSYKKKFAVLHSGLIVSTYNQKNVTNYKNTNIKISYM